MFQVNPDRVAEEHPKGASRSPHHEFANIALCRPKGVRPGPGPGAVPEPCLISLAGLPRQAVESQRGALNRARLRDRPRAGPRSYPL